jgi:hypothetical protein
MLDFYNNILSAISLICLVSKLWISKCWGFDK